MKTEENAHTPIMPPICPRVSIHPGYKIIMMVNKIRRIKPPRRILLLVLEDFSFPDFRAAFLTIYNIIVKNHYKDFKK